MAFNINGYGNQPSVTKNDRLQKSNDEQESSKSVQAEKSGTLADDTVKLSGAAQSMQSHQSKINSMPDMDMAKVEQIKLAISSGQYKVDSEKLASNMVAMDSMF
ncbi:MAG: flagellar biosynthesis anti-sigma factor FlgM [Marinomonas sp.]|jgi:negative regulator of flagellin synthesis FlgM